MRIELEAVKEAQGVETGGWSKEFPIKADAGDAYYFVRRVDRNDVVVMGFSMGKGWLNGVSCEPSEMRSHLFLGPLSPSDTEELFKLREEVEALRRDNELLSWDKHAGQDLINAARAGRELIAANALLRQAAEKALTFVDEFGANAPIAFGGEAELSAQLRKALGKE